MKDWQSAGNNALGRVLKEGKQNSSGVKTPAFAALFGTAEAVPS